MACSCAVACELYGWRKWNQSKTSKNYRSLRRSSWREKPCSPSENILRERRELLRLEADYSVPVKKRERSILFSQPLLFCVLTTFPIERESTKREKHLSEEREREREGYQHFVLFLLYVWRLLHLYMLHVFSVLHSLCASHMSEKRREEKKLSERSLSQRRINRWREMYSEGWRRLLSETQYSQKSRREKRNILSTILREKPREELSYYQCGCLYCLQPSLKMWLSKCACVCLHWENRRDLLHGYTPINEILPKLEERSLCSNLQRIAGTWKLMREKREPVPTTYRGSLCTPSLSGKPWLRPQKWLINSPPTAFSFGCCPASYSLHATCL